MVQHFIEPEFCLVPDSATAKLELYLRTDKLLDPIPYLHFYKESNIRALNWIAQDGDEQYVLPAFGSHNDPKFFFEERERIQLHNRSFFRCQGEFFLITEEKERGLCLKQLSIICNQALLQLVARSGNLKDYEFILCKAYEISQEHPFICYLWSGYKTNPLSGRSSTAMLPVFIEDFHELLQYERRDLHLIPLEVGEIMKYKDQNFVVKSAADGIYIDDLSNALLNKRRP